ncbi:MAG: hypothetical protein AAGK04_10425, partial [Planctomycetota bacterium]
MTTLIALLLAAVAALAVQPAPPQAPPPMAPRATPPSVPRAFASPDDLMDATQAATNALDRVSFDVNYTKLFLIADSLESRKGRALIVTDTRSRADRLAQPEAPPRRAFGLRFDSLQIDRRLQQEIRELAFDGEWLIERIPHDQLMVRRQLAPPGDRADAFKLGEGPFMVMVGQDKTAVRQRYNATIPTDPTQGLADHIDERVSKHMTPVARDAIQLH